MIRGFANSETENLYAGTASRYLPPDIQCSARRKLLQLDAADRLDIMRRPPGNRLEAPKGRRRGQHRMPITTNGASAFVGKARAFAFYGRFAPNGELILSARANNWGCV